MLTVCTLLFDPPKHMPDYSRIYDETWVEKLYRGFTRNLTIPFRFVCFTDRPRKFDLIDIEQARLTSALPGQLDYGCCIEPFRLGGPMFVAGLDTIIVGNINHLAEYCLSGDRLGLPRDPYGPPEGRPINGITLSPSHLTRKVYDDWVADGGRENDMNHIRKYPFYYTDELWPAGQIASFKGAKIAERGLPKDCRLVFYHGRPKPGLDPEVTDMPWVRDHWR